jgi:hypothetical protein
MKKFILLTICLFVSFTAFSQTTTSQAGAWNSGATWGGSVPTSGTNVVIAHDVTCNSEQTAGTMTVNSGITLTVNTAGKLTANGEVTNNGTIVVTGGENASGSLIAKDASSFTYTYKLYIPATEWKLVGIPVTNLTVDDVDNDLATNGSKVGIGYYDSTSSSWVVLLSSATTTLLDQTRGYEMMHSTGAVVDFTGGLRTQDRSTTTTFLNKWTLLGNPFPSYLRLSNDATGASGSNYFLNSTHLSYLKNTHQNVWGWDGSAYDSYSNSNASGGTLDNIAPGDAFWVYGAGTETFTFTETMQVHHGGQGFRNSSAQGNTDDSKPSRLALVKFSVFDENSKRYLSVVFGDDFSIGLDPGEDIGGFRAGDSHMYTQLMDGHDKVDFAIQALPYEKISDITIPVGIETEGGKIRLEYNKNTLPEYIDMYLEDTQENTFKKITDGFEINFDEAYEGLGRFYLHFTDQLIPELPTDDNLRIYKGSDSDVMVMGSVGKNYTAKVYDYSGRLIKEVNFNHKTKINDLDSKMKILRIESEEGLTIKKFKLN